MRLEVKSLKVKMHNKQIYVKKILFLFFLLFVNLLFLCDNAISSDLKAPRSEEELRTINIYKACKDSVVFISTLTISQDPFDMFMGQERKEGSGSGVIIDSKKGIVLTNLHVIQNASDLIITINEKEKTRAKLIGYDNEYDIAVLQMIKYPTTIKAISLGDSSTLEVGQKVIAIGNPFGLSKTLTTGVISNLNRTVRNPNNFLMKGLIQTDASINPGNSGGPLIDMGGRIIGLNTAILSSSGDSAGIGFAIPVNYLRRILPELINTGKVSRPDLGLVMVDTSQGVMIQRVEKQSPLVGLAYPAEIEIKDRFTRGFIRDFSKADLIYSIDGVRVYNKEQVDEIVAKAGTTKELKIVLKRGSIYAEDRVVKVKALLK
ncbi:MAG: trypsin-like peptidase domain-containing protein [Bdellovibrionota bacterium]|nr:trypsin-like peptidase domain-containing protein [Pseudomonadota bacterium]MDY6091127.1 trypsin-like peptidase domain-containing protein [Bdellovibrionota bacterium]